MPNTMGSLVSLTLSALMNRLEQNGGSFQVQSEQGYTYDAMCTFNKPATDAEIIEFEEKTGFLLPDDYKAFLKITNGCRLFEHVEYGGETELFSLEQIIEYNSHLDPCDGCFNIAYIYQDHIGINSDLHREGNPHYLFWKGHIDSFQEALPLQSNFELWLDRFIISQGVKFWWWPIHTAKNFYQVSSFPENDGEAGIRKQIWASEEESPFRLQPLTDGDIKEAEGLLNVKLPDSYIKVLREQNGGSLLFNAHHIPASACIENGAIQIDHLLGIGKDRGILETPYLLKEWDMPEGLVLLSGDGHSWVTLDYRDRKEQPPVVYVDNEAKLIVNLASSFTDFLEGLSIHYEEDEFVEWEEKKWTEEELRTAIASGNEQSITEALNHLYQEPEGKQLIIEESLLKLLRGRDLEIRQLAANFAGYFHEDGHLSGAALEKITTLLNSDPETAYYVDMYFSGH